MKINTDDKTVRDEPIHLIIPIIAEALPLVRRALMMVNYRKKYQVLRQTSDYTWYYAEDGGSFLGALAALDLEFGDRYPILINIKNQSKIAQFNRALEAHLNTADQSEWQFQAVDRTDLFGFDVLNNLQPDPVSHVELRRAVPGPGERQLIVEKAFVLQGPLRILTASDDPTSFTDILDVFDPLLLQ